ncbi:MAG: acyltransferase domain-containing protein [Deltaproteobacteria bacterium]|nr:acyltransferase domain-containing protein [Deltaproteobacteria bacterium]
MKTESQLLVLFANETSALVHSHLALAAHLKNCPDVSLNDLGYTLLQQSHSFRLKNVVLGTDMESTIRRLEEQALILRKSKSIPPMNRRVVFVFPGQGVQYAGMGAALYKQEPIFRNVVNECAKKYIPILGVDIRELMFASGVLEQDANERLKQTNFTQPTVFVIEYALARLMQHYGVEPDAMIGHSIGQYAAACLAEIFDFDVCLRLVAERGRVIQEMSPGQMLSVPMAANELEKRLNDEVGIASVNAPELCVASGPAEAIGALQKELEGDGINSTLLRTSHAFHSDMMIRATEAFERVVSDVERRPPKIPIVCTATGTWIKDDEAMAAQHWADQIRRAVLFSPGIQTLLNDSSNLFVEVGPRSTMSTLIKRHLAADDQKRHVIVPLMGRPNENEIDNFSKAMGMIARADAPINLKALYESPSSHLVELPAAVTTPCVQSDFAEQDENAISEAEADGPLSEVEQFLKVVWENILSVSSVGRLDDFFDLGGHSLVGLKLADRIREEYGISMLLSDFMKHSVLHEMATAVEELKNRGNDDSRDRDWTPLVPLCKAGKHPAVFCVAGINGHSMELRNLANDLRDIPFYGLETRGVAPGQIPHETIEALANEHVSAIRTVQATGPYYLCGYSMGGVVAFEMAKQLVSKGEKIAWLGLIDSTSPVLRQRTAFEFRLVMLSRYIKNPGKFIRRFMERRRPATPEDEAKARYGHIYNVMWKARDNYRPDPYPGNVVLFRTPKSIFIEDIRWTIDAFNGWGPIVNGEITVIPVKGRHLTVVQEPGNVAYLAKLMRDSIRSHS